MKGKSFEEQGRESMELILPQLIFPESLKVSEPRVAQVQAEAEQTKVLCSVQGQPLERFPA